MKPSSSPFCKYMDGGDDRNARANILKGMANEVIGAFQAHSKLSQAQWCAMLEEIVNRYAVLLA